VWDLMTTVLDAIAVLLIAAGVILGLWPYIGGWSVAAGGLVVGAAVQVSTRLSGED
jgi:hypothetical protein